MITHPELLRLVLAGKGVGSQGDGSVQFLCRDEESQRRVSTWSINFVIASVVLMPTFCGGRL